MLDGRGRRDVVQDALTAVALDDGVVLAHLLEDLRAEANVAYGTEAVAGGGAESDPLARFRDLLE
jgi:hypothetical protein